MQYKKWQDCDQTKGTGDAKKVLCSKIRDYNVMSS